MTLHSYRNRGLVRIYDVGNWTHGKPRYCLLYFNRHDVCRDVRMVGVSATTKRNEAGGATPADPQDSDSAVPQTEPGSADAP